MTNECDVAWLAGILDGEGTVSIVVSSTLDKGTQKRYARVAARVAFYNSDTGIMEMCAKTLMGILGRPIRPAKMKTCGVARTDGGQKRQMYVITIASQEELPVVIEALQPYMHSGDKLERAAYILDWCRLRAAEGIRLGDGAKALITTYRALYGRDVPTLIADTLH